MGQQLPNRLMPRFLSLRATASAADKQERDNTCLPGFFGRVKAHFHILLPLPEVVPLGAEIPLPIAPAGRLPILDKGPKVATVFTCTLLFGKIAGR